MPCRRWRVSNIDWTYGGSIAVAASRARQMMAGYQIQFPAALESRHTQRRAIDMTIGWHGTLNIRDFNGQSHAHFRSGRRTAPTRS